MIDTLKSAWARLEKRRVRARIARTPLFNAAYYVSRYGALDGVAGDPLGHYLEHGAELRLDPHPLFDTEYYLRRRPEAGAQEVPPLLHFIENGADPEDPPDPHPLFDSRFYFRNNPEVLEKGLNPLIHFLEIGAARMRDPHPLFDTAFYFDQNPELRLKGINPLLHYLAAGVAEGYDPNASFDSRYYLDANPDVEHAGLNPLQHFVQSGAAEGRKPNHLFVTQRFLADFAELKLSTATLRAYTADSPRSDFETYEHLRAEIRRLKEIRDGHFQPTPMVGVEFSGDEDAALAMRGLRAPAAASPLVSIVIPVFNNFKLTAEGLASLSRFTKLDEHEVVIVDDASTDCTPTALGAIDGVRYLRNDENLGFLHSCMRGAEAARGKYLLFLNNDTQFTEGWLEALLESFAEHDDLGAVGPKLVFPDGRLQEAGVAIRPDATSVLIGLLSDPGKACFSYSRMVDYCSGACLLVSKAAFREVGGFDTRFAPAYCEDVDLCLGLRRAGYQIAYNPRSVVIHHLSATANLLVESFKIECVKRNRQLLLAKWHEEIAELNRVRLIAFYDSSPVDVAHQIEVASRCGIYGFCFRIRDPHDAGAGPELPYCYALDAASAQQLAAMASALAGRFEDAHYLRIFGKPLLLILASSDAGLDRLAARWRRRCRRGGVGEIYLAVCEPALEGAGRSPAELGYDAAFELPSHDPSAPRSDQRRALRRARRDLPGYTRWGGVMLSRDATRANASPGAYRAWLESTVEDVRLQAFGEERIVLLDGWTGRAGDGGYLTATREALAGWHRRQQD